MDLGIAGRTAVVAAATSGLGLAVACELAAEGVDVSICGRDRDRLDAALERLREAAADGAATHGAVVDVRDPDQLADWLGGVEEELGAPDIAVANAGGPPKGGTGDFDLAAYRDALELNLLSSVALSQQVLPAMRAREWGRLLFITSMSVKQPLRGLALSNTARPGVVGYAKSLVQELGPCGVTVNVLAPGAHVTPRSGLDDLPAAERERRLAEIATAIPLGRRGEPREFAAAAVFLASERASYITGTVLQVDGGAHSGLT